MKCSVFDVKNNLVTHNLHVHMNSFLRKNKPNMDMFKRKSYSCREHWLIKAEVFFSAAIYRTGSTTLVFTGIIKKQVWIKISYNLRLKYVCLHKWSQQYVSFISFNNICYTLDKIRRGILSYYIKNQYLYCLLCRFVVCLT